MLSEEIPSDSWINIITKWQKTRMRELKGKKDCESVKRQKSDWGQSSLLVRGQLHVWKGKNNLCFKGEKIKLDSQQQLTGDTALGI